MELITLILNSKNIRIVQDAMFGSTNEVMGTSYKSRIDDKKYQFAGKTGTAQVKKITEKDRELDLKTFEIITLSALVIPVIFVFIIHKTWIPHEEVKLKEKFGKDWEKYAASTSRWLG